MVRPAVLVSLIALVCVLAATSAVPVVAQDASPAADMAATMSLEETQAVIDGYLTALVDREDIAPFFSDDVVLTLVEFGQEIQGREAVAGAIVDLHQQTFDARPEVM